VRLLPLDSGSDLYLYKHPDVPASLLYLVRPYQPKDEADIYRLVAAAYEEQIDAPMGKSFQHLARIPLGDLTDECLVSGLCRSDRELIGDHAVGAYLTLSPEFCFVCESSLDGSIVGYVVASQDSKIFHTRYQMAWLPEMRTKYPRKQVDVTANEDVMLTPIEEIAQSFHSDKETKLPSCVYSTQVHPMEP
jgi:protein O-GlcNAcase/histone acetyltransferase